MPRAAPFADDWKLGTPDLVLEPDEDFAIPASGPDVYRCFVLPTNLTRETFVTAVDFRPANRRVVHHISAYLDTTGAARARDKAEKGPGYTAFSGPGIPIFEELCFWTAGHEPHHLPNGIGRGSSPGRRDHPGPLPPQRQARGRSHAARYLFLRATRSSRPCTGTRRRTSSSAARGQVKHRGRGELVRPRRRRGPGRLAAHAHAGPRHADVCQLSQRPDPGPDPHPRLGPRLAEHLLLPRTDFSCPRARLSRLSPTSTTRRIRGTPTILPSP